MVPDAHQKRNEKVARFKRDKAIAARVTQIRAMKKRETLVKQVGARKTVNLESSIAQLDGTSFMLRMRRSILHWMALMKNGSEHSGN